jgi:hypothetical protein
LCASSGTFPTTFQRFAQSLNWYQDVTSAAIDPTHNEPHVQVNIKMVVKYFDRRFQHPTTSDVRFGGWDHNDEHIIERRLAHASGHTGVGVVPFVIATLAMQNDVSLEDDDSRTLDKWTRLREIVLDVEASSTNVHPDTHHRGPPTKSNAVAVFVERTLRLRALYVQNKPAFNVYCWFEPGWASVPQRAAPPPCTFDFSATSHFPETRIAFCFAEASLQSLMTPTLFRLLPVGVDDEADFVREYVGKHGVADTPRCVAYRYSQSRVESRRHAQLHVELPPAPEPLDTFEIAPVDDRIDVASFPNGSDADNHALAQWLHANPNRTIIVRPTDPVNPVCNVFMATYWCDTATVEFVLIDFQDRRNTKPSELSFKLSELTKAENVAENMSSTTNSDHGGVVPTDEAMSAFHIVCNLILDGLTPRVLLIFAGCGESTFAVCQRTVEPVFDETSQRDDDDVSYDSYDD